MNAGLKPVSFVAALVVVFGLSWAAGAAVSDDPAPRTTTTSTTTTTMPSHGDHPGSGS